MIIAAATTSPKPRRYLQCELTRIGIYMSDSITMSASCSKSLLCCIVVWKAGSGIKVVLSVTVIHPPQNNHAHRVHHNLKTLVNSVAHLDLHQEY